MTEEEMWHCKTENEEVLSFIKFILHLAEGNVVHYGSEDP